MKDANGTGDEGDAAVTLSEYMKNEGLSVLALAQLAGVSWRSARDAASGRLRTASTAARIAAAVGPTVDASSMLEDVLGGGR